MEDHEAVWLMRSRTLIIIPCSNRKRPDGLSGVRWSRRLSAAKRLSPKGSGRLLEARSEIARMFGYKPGMDLGVTRRAKLELMPASKRYDGNVYRKIDAHLWPAAGSRSSVQVVIVSALYGLLVPEEPIREYYRTMSDTVRPRITLARWWSERGLGELLVEYVQQTGARIVHDFLSGVYAGFAERLSSLKGHVKVCHHSYPRLGFGADHHRGWDVRSFLMRAQRTPG